MYIEGDYKVGTADAKNITKEVNILIPIKYLPTDKFD